MFKFTFNDIYVRFSLGGPKLGTFLNKLLYKFLWNSGPEREVEFGMLLRS